MSFSERPKRVGAALAACAVVAAGAARASPDYPEALGAELGMPCPPPCTVCHRDANGGFFTVVKPFGRAMIEVGGLGPRSPEELPPAIQALESAKTDSDGDGASDIDELRAAEDPNRPGAQSLCGPVYGCGARVAPDAPRWHASLSFLGAALVLSLRSRARRRTQ